MYFDPIKQAYYIPQSPRASLCIDPADQIYPKISDWVPVLISLGTAMWCFIYEPKFKV